MLRNRRNKNVSSKKRPKWESRPLFHTIHDIVYAHAYGDVPSMEDLAKLGWIVSQGMTSQPLRLSNKEKQKKRDSFSLTSNAEINDPDGLLSAALGGEEMIKAKTKHRGVKKTYDVEYDEWVVFPLTNCVARRWVIDPKRKAEAKRLGILVPRDRAFDSQPIRVTKDLLCDLIDLVEFTGGSYRRRTNAKEEKDGVQ